MRHVNRVPVGALKDLMLQRVRDLTGLRPEVAAPAVGVSNRFPNAASRRQKGALEEHLLAMLLRRPDLLRYLSAEQLEAIVTRRGESLFRDVAKYVAEHPDADPAQILGRWSGNRHHEELTSLLRVRGALAAEVATVAEAEATEFAEAVDRFIAAAKKQDRRRLVDEMREEPSQEKLAHFISQNQESATN